MNNLKIALFAYSFPHKKTQDFIFYLIGKGYTIDTIYAADAVKLNVPPSSIRTKIKHIGLIEPKEVASSLGIRLVNMRHDDPLIVDDIKSRCPSLGIIAGARILRPFVIDAFPLGVINFHPGDIPSARGLDALLWSIYNSIPLAVTAHLIDSKIDAGRILEVSRLPIFETDTLFDLSERLYDMQLAMIDQAIERAVKKQYRTIRDYGRYNRKMPPDLEKEVLAMIPSYISKFKTT